MPFTIPEKRPYQRKLHNEIEQGKLEDNGYEVVFSSNVSAIKEDGKDLIIRFHNSSVYRYPNQGKNYERMMAASSKGKWVWRNLRRKNVPYQKIGSFTLPSDDTRTDEEVVRPRTRKYNVTTLLPSTEEQMRGVLPQISITPIEAAIALTSFNSSGGLIGAALASAIIKGT